MEPKTARRVTEVQASHSTPMLTAGICAETIVMTLEGEKPAHSLRPGQSLVTRDSGTAVLREIRLIRVESEMIRVKAGSLGHKRPPDDVSIAPGTEVLLRDWRAEALFGQKQSLVTAQRLQDGEFVALEPAAEITLAQLIFDSPHVIYAGGLELRCQTPIQG